MIIQNEFIIVVRIIKKLGSESFRRGEVGVGEGVGNI